MKRFLYLFILALVCFISLNEVLISQTKSNLYTKNVNLKIGTFKSNVETGNQSKIEINNNNGSGSNVIFISNSKSIKGKIYQYRNFQAGKEPSVAIIVWSNGATDTLNLISEEEFIIGNIRYIYISK